MEFDPADTVTDAGTVKTGLVFVRVMTAPPVGAALVKVTVHVLVPFGPRLLGLHDRVDTRTAAVRLTVVLAELLLYVAVTVALWSLLTVPVVALNVFEVDPAATVADAGTANVGFVFANVTTAPPVGAALVKVTVQVLVPFGPRLLGLHDRVDTRTAAVRLTVVLAELLLYVAVTVALWSLLTVPVVALNVFEVDPAATVADAGTANVGFVFANVTTAPPEGAALVKVTVHVLVPFGPRLLGLHDRVDTRTAAVRLTVVLAELPLYVAVTVAL